MTKTTSFNIPLAISAGLLFVGYIFRFHHWPYAFQIEATGYIMIASLYTTRFSLKTEKKPKDLIKLFLITFWCLASILSINSLSFLYLLQILVTILGIIWLVMEIVDIVLKKTKNLNIILFIGGIILAVEILFRFQWWPGGALLHLLALIVIIIGFSIDGSKQLPK
jgi:hypothetical protein